MKFIYKKVFVVLLFIFHYQFCFSEGFAAETLVKVPDGYKNIEKLCPGDWVACYDGVNKKNVESVITCVVKKTVDSYVRIVFDGESIYVARDQQFYDALHNTWITADLLSKLDKFFVVEHINESIDLYLICVAQYHNFFVSLHNICAHNFVPIVVGVSLAFGSGAIELTGITCGFVGLGACLGYKWHKKNKEHNFAIQPLNCGGGMVPEDPNDKDKKADEFRALSNKEARDLAEKVGYKEVKAPFDTHGELTFKKGNTYISPDNTGHNGGVWKMFKRNGLRIGTWNKDLTIRIKG